MTLQSIEKLRESLKACTSEAGVEPNRFDTYWITARACDMLIDGIESEIAERFVELPVDEDEITICVGDVVQGLGDSGPVQHLELWDGGWVVVFELAPGQLTRYSGDAVHHVKPRTVEDVLCDMIHEYACTDMTTEQTAAKYAAELRDLLEVRDD